MFAYCCLAACRQWQAARTLAAMQMQQATNMAARKQRALLCGMLLGWHRVALGLQPRETGGVTCLWEEVSCHHGMHMRL